MLSSPRSLGLGRGEVDAHGRVRVVDRSDDRALGHDRAADGRDRGADGRDDRALGLHVAADGRHRDEEGRDLRSLGLDVTADGLHQDEHGLEVDALRGDRAPDGGDADADGRDVDALPSDGNARGGDGDEARREVDAGGGQSDAWGERGGEREVLARFDREEREKKRSENVGEKKRAKKTNVERGKTTVSAHSSPVMALVMAPVAEANLIGEDTDLAVTWMLNCASCELRLARKASSLSGPTTASPMLFISVVVAFHLAGSTAASGTIELTSGSSACWPATNTEFAALVMADLV